MPQFRSYLSWASFSILVTLGAPFASQADPSLLINDKEARSVLVNDDYHPTISESQATELSVALERILLGNASQNIAPLTCEPRVLARFEQVLQQAGLPTDPESMTAILKSLRIYDRIDDLILLPLLKTVPIQASVKTEPTPDGTPFSSAQDTDPEREATWSLFQDLTGMCPTDAFFRVQDKLKEQEGRKYKLHHLNREVKKAAEYQMLSPYAKDWLLELSRQGWSKLPFTLTKIIRTMKLVKNDSLPDQNKSAKSTYASLRVEHSDGLTHRMALYSKYSAEQIILLRKEYRAFERHNSGYTELVHHNDASHSENGEIETRRLSPQGQYRVAAGWLHEDLVDELARSGNFARKTVEYDDVMEAVLETGLVAAEDLETVMKVREVWDPQMKPEAKILKILQHFTGTLGMFIPPPYGGLLALGTLFLSTYVVKNHSQDPRPSDIGTSLF